MLGKGCLLHEDTYLEHILCPGHIFEDVATSVAVEVMLDVMAS